MEASGNDVSEKTCHVCGHVLGPHLRICDRCGSIQRHSKVREKEIQPQRLGRCERCGAPVPPDEALCAKCYVAIMREARGAGRGRRRAATAVLIALSLVLIAGAAAGLVVFDSDMVFISVLVVGSIAFLATVSSLAVVLRRSRVRVEVHPSAFRREGS